MSPLTFKLKEKLSISIDLSEITPDKFVGKDHHQINQTLLAAGKEHIKVMDLFEVEGEDTENILINGHCELARYIGLGMSHGTLTIEGNVGHYVGMKMQGGTLIIKGNAGNFAASSLQDGTVYIQGNVGQFLGAPIPGDSYGMSGGLVIVNGDAGDRTGDKMRRGIMLIKGNVGDYCGSQMIAGTIAVGRNAGSNIGFSMQRGTLLLKQMPQLLATFNDCGTHHLPFLGLLQNYLASTEFDLSEFINQGVRVRRFIGDRGNGGLGEVLIYS
jgi:formylmethanofuran dehydrogenase subunit C